MDMWQFGLALGALFTLMVSVGNPRGFYWTMFISANFIAGSIYQHLELPHQPLFVLATDLVFCITIDILRKNDYELTLYGLFRWSCFVSAVRIAEVEYIDEIYVPILEGIVWLSFIIISLESLKKLGIVRNNAAAHLISALSFVGYSPYKNSAMEKSQWFKKWK